MRKRFVYAATVAITPSLLIGLLAGQAAHAAPNSLAPPVTAGPSGIGLAPALHGTAHGTLANATYYNKALKSRRWVRTPGGLVYHSCMYNVPNGSEVDSINGRINLPNGRSISMTRCAYPRLIQPKGPRQAQARAGLAAAQAQPLATTGWMQGFEQDGLAPLEYLHVKYAAPAAPAQTSGVLEDYMWSALASDPAGDSLLQPAAGWGNVLTEDHGVVHQNGSGPYLDMAAYYYWSGNSVAASFVRINAADTLEAIVTGASCNGSGGGCTWFLEIYDDNTTALSDFTVVSAPAYTTVIGGMLESYHATNCQMLFANHNIAWRGLVLRNLAGATLSPAFHRRLVDQECSMATTWSPSGGNITWTP